MFNDLFGSKMTGGKKKTLKSPKTTSKKTTNRRVVKKYRGGAEEKVEPTIDVNWGDKKYRCTELSEAKVVAPPPLPGKARGDIQTIQDLPKNVDTDITAALINNIKESQTKIDSSQTGGKKTKRYVKNLSPKGQYKRYLEKMTLDKLQKMSKKYNIKITTKKNGKMVNIKKDSLVNKLVRIRYPSK
jgi:hypothetical protein